MTVDAYKVDFLDLDILERLEIALIFDYKDALEYMLLDTEIYELSLTLKSSCPEPK